MSYCVNCGVELEKSLKSCPLCNTPVLNPRDINTAPKMPPYPQTKGNVEEANRKDAALFISIVLVATAVGCGILNWLVYSKTLWSVPIIGFCVVLWVMLIPVFIYRKASVYFSLLMDGAAMGVYLYMITWLTQEKHWFFGLGLPIVVLITVLAEAVALCFKRLPKSILCKGLYVITALGIGCTGLELMIDHYLNGTFFATWSAIVGVVCIIIDVMIVLLLCRRRLRNEIRRRLHF